MEQLKTTTKKKKEIFETKNLPRDKTTWCDALTISNLKVGHYAATQEAQVQLGPGVHQRYFCQHRVQLPVRQEIFLFYFTVYLFYKKHHRVYVYS